MAIYKTISSKEIVRKVMRDLNPEGADWIHDTIEWIGEALEHIGASAQLDTKICVVPIKDYKGMVPNDLYYIQQVGLSNAINAEETTEEIIELRKAAMDLTAAYKQSSSSISAKIQQSVDGTYTSSLTTGDVEQYSNFKKVSDNELREINSRLAVLEGTLTGGDALPNVVPLQYCTTTFPDVECPDCRKDLPSECYYVENDYIKTTFPEGALCVSYKAFPTDADCYPLVPDSVSYKEAMFWYVYKKMLLGGQFDPNRNGINYGFADQQWKYYCTQSRNEAVFPDIDRMENFMNQWVRLIPDINRHAMTFDLLAEREDLYRGRYNTYGQRGQ
jgi:hypothetical protein